METDRRTNEIMALLTEVSQEPALRGMQAELRADLWACLIDNSEENGEVIDGIIERIKRLIHLCKTSK